MVGTMIICIGDKKSKISTTATNKTVRGLKASLIRIFIYCLAGYIFIGRNFITELKIFSVAIFFGCSISWIIYKQKGNIKKE
jgi:hypothetical protein